MNELINKVAQWHRDRNLIDGASDKDQFCKLIQEAGELSDSICKGKDVKDDIGDMIVVLINIAERNNLSLDQLSFKNIKKIDSSIKKDVLKILKTENSVYSKKSYGGTSLQNVVKMLKKLKKEFK